MSIPDKDYFWRSSIGTGLFAPIKLALRWPYMMKKYIVNQYANGFWWDKDMIRRLSPTERVEILPSDSFYRFDLIERKNSIE